MSYESEKNRSAEELEKTLAVIVSPAALIMPKNDEGEEVYGSPLQNFLEALESYATPRHRRTYVRVFRPRRPSRLVIFC